MNPTPDGPEHLPLPPAARAETRKAGGSPRVRSSAPVPKAAVAVLAVAIAGAGAWLASGRRPAAPAVPAAPVASDLAAPTPVTPTVPVVEVPAQPPSPPAAAGPEVATLPELPTAEEPAFIPDASSALSPEAGAMEPARVAQLFNRSIGGFVPYKDQPERHVVISLGLAVHQAGLAQVPARGAAVRPGLAQVPAQAEATQTRAARGRLATHPGLTPGPAQGAPAPPAVADPTCSDCDQALANSGMTNLRPNGTRVGAKLEYVGPCKDGYVYRVTNLLDAPLPSSLIAPDGEVWKSGGIKPSESLEIRSRAPIDRVTFVP